MDRETKELLSKSLFANTSAFAQAREAQKPQEPSVPQQKVGSVVYSAHHKIAEIVERIQIHLDSGDVDLVYDDLDEIKELL